MREDIALSRPDKGDMHHFRSLDEEKEGEEGRKKGPELSLEASQRLFALKHQPRRIHDALVRHIPKPTPSGCPSRLLPLWLGGFPVWHEFLMCEIAGQIIGLGTPDWEREEEERMTSVFREGAIFKRGRANDPVGWIPYEDSGSSTDEEGGRAVKVKSKVAAKTNKVSHPEAIFAAFSVHSRHASDWGRWFHCVGPFIAEIIYQSLKSATSVFWMLWPPALYSSPA